MGRGGSSVPTLPYIPLTSTRTPASIHSFVRSFIHASKNARTDTHARIFTQPREKVSDVIATQGNFSSSAGKDQRRRWSVHTSESSQRMPETAVTVAGGRRASR